jgi:hypothetical protein
MRRNVLRLLAGLVIVLVAAAVVGVVAYHLGSNAAGAPAMRGMPGRGFVDARGVDWPGLGLLGFIGCVLIGVLVIWLLAALLSPDRGGPSLTGSATGDVERLRELSAMHTQGLLTDDEFSAAKRKLLGL